MCLSDRGWFLRCGRNGSEEFTSDLVAPRTCIHDLVFHSLELFRGLFSVANLFNVSLFLIQFSLPNLCALFGISANKNGIFYIDVRSRRPMANEMPMWMSVRSPFFSRTLNGCRGKSLVKWQNLFEISELPFRSKSIFIIFIFYTIAVAAEISFVSQLHSKHTFRRFRA